MWTPGHGPDLRGVHRPTCPIGVDDVDERRFNPLCRRDSDTDPDPDDSDDDDDDDDDSDSSGCDLVENAHRARLNDLRRLDRDREEIRRQNETLERIRVARCEQRHMAEELASMRFEAERRHTLAWGDDTDVKRRERAAERAAEAIGDAMDEDELVASTRAGQSSSPNADAEEARAWADHERAWAEFETSVRGGARVRVTDVPWPPGGPCRGGGGDVRGGTLASLARRELIETGSHRRKTTDGDTKSQSDKGGPEDRRLAAFRRAFRRASLRWHPDKFEGKFGNALSADACVGDDDGERDGGSEKDGVGETHAQRIRRRVRCIAQEINDAWSAIVA
tara:strand:- start:32 stop:1039 length:1008 start_codon:yes stop_codon:yes gene_type:complete